MIMSDEVKSSETTQGTFAAPLTEEWMMNGSALAFLGDAVYGLMARDYVLHHGSKQPDRLHKHATKLVNAAAQSEMILALMEHLTEEEVSVFKRGRNSSTATSAKNQKVADYRRATGLEALFGYLYLSGREARMKELFALGVELIQGGTGQKSE